MSESRRDGFRTTSDVARVLRDVLGTIFPKSPFKFLTLEGKNLIELRVIT